MVTVILCCCYPFAKDDASLNLCMRVKILQTPSKFLKVESKIIGSSCPNLFPLNLSILVNSLAVTPIVIMPMETLYCEYWVSHFSTADLSNNSHLL